MKEKKPKKKRNILLRVLVFVLTAAVVVGAASLVIFRDRLNIDALRRWFTYRSLALSDSGQAESFPYSGSPEDVFADVGGDLLVCGKNVLGLYSGSGVQYIDRQVSMPAPAVSVSGDSAVVYDAGGTALMVIRQRAVAFELESDGPLLSARLNGNGMLTVVSQESGYRGVVNVYGRDGSERAGLRLSSAYIMDALLSDDGVTLWVVTVGQEGGSFSSTLSVYDLSAIPTNQTSYDVTPTATAGLGNNVILALAEKDGALCALGDGGFLAVSAGGRVLGSVDWSDRYLRSCAAGSGSLALALTGQYRSGGQSALYVMDGGGSLIGSLAVGEQVLSMDAAGDYFAVLTADRLDIYTADLALYSTLSGTQGAQRVLLRADGSAMLISPGSARLFVPS